jgi:hypothetical protein
MAATSEEVVEREASARRLAGIAALVAAGLEIAVTVVSLVLAGRQEPRFLVQGLREAAGQAGDAPSLATRSLLFFDDNAPLILVSAVLSALATLLIAFVLAFLADATRARRPETPGWLRPVVITGGVFAALSLIVVQVVYAIDVADFASSADQSRAAADDVGASPIIGTGRLLATLGGQFLIPLGFVLVSLNAMRAGLLTRFLGILGIIAGVLLLVPQLFGGGLPIVQVVFLAATGLLLLRITTEPPAWPAGTAIPWPTQQELREAREREAAGGAQTASRPERPAAGGDGSTAGQRRKKRKRRG